MDEKVKNRQGKVRLMKKREMAILELLTENDKMDVSALAGRLGVSQVTIRKDLVELEKRSVIKREHGYARLGGVEDINNRIAYHHEQKRLIAGIASSLVNNGETLMIESGSCCALLAEELALTKPNCTIVTNSAFIAGYIRHIDGARIVLLGGDFQNNAQVMVGPIVRDCASQFYVDKLFIGVDGYSCEHGFAGDDHLRAQAVRDMAEFADKVFVVTESLKFRNHGIVPLNLRKPVYGVITDADVPEEIQTHLDCNGTVVYKATM